MIELGQYEIWFVTGSQHLYGPETLERVAEHARAIANALDDAADIPVRVVYQPVLTDSDAIRRLCQAANATPACVGVVAWMHTFSPLRCGSAGWRRCANPWRICTPNSTATSPGPTSTWTS